MTDRKTPLRSYADLFRDPEPVLTLEMVQKAVFDEVYDNTLLSRDACEQIARGVIDRIRQGGGQ